MGTQRIVVYSAVDWHHCGSEVTTAGGAAWAADSRFYCRLDWIYLVKARMSRASSHCSVSLSTISFFLGVRLTFITTGSPSAGFFTSTLAELSSAEIGLTNGVVGVCAYIQFAPLFI